MIQRILIRILPLVATVIGLWILLSLGFWQLDRGAEKTLIKNAFDQRIDLPPLELSAVDLTVETHEYFRANVSGQFLADGMILHDNRIVKGVSGLDVYVPFQPADAAKQILVNLGWVPWSTDRTRYREFSIPQGEQHLYGLLLHPSEDFYTLEKEKPAADALIWQNLDLAHYRQVKAADIQPMILMLAPAENSVFERQWPVYNDDWIARHKGYAVQWFGLAGVLLIIYLVSVYRQFKSRAQ